MSAAKEKIIATVACDLELSPIGTRSRLLEVLDDRAVLAHTIEQLRAVALIDEIVLIAPAEQHARLRDVVGAEIRLMALIARPVALDRRVKTARAWGLNAWRGGAGQFTVFDEDYHPASVAAAVAATGAAHVISVAAHAALIDPALLTALLTHHCDKNLEMRATFMPAAPGLAALVLRAGIVLEMAQHHVLPMQLLHYDPSAPMMDTLIRDACMQVDPALSKIPNRFLLDNDRTWGLLERIDWRNASPVEMALAAREAERAVAFEWPREVEIELTTRRMTTQYGVSVRCGEVIGERSAGEWADFFAGQRWPDDVAVTFAGDGDPLLYGDLVAVLRAARQAGANHIHVQSDLVTAVDGLVAAAEDGLIDIISVNQYGLTAETHAAVAGVDRATAEAQIAARTAAMVKLAGTQAFIFGRLMIVPRLLKCRETIADMEPFFDEAVRRYGWGVIDGPTDRAGSVRFAAVVDMAPPRRFACRRLWTRTVVRCDGVIVACDQAADPSLTLDNSPAAPIPRTWRNARAMSLRQAHLAGALPTPCITCREWHRA